jgi:hypothetical protein
MSEPRTLAVDDRIAAYPCEVTIDRLASTLAYGRCASCEVEHIIDRRNYDRGHGPWNPVYIGQGDSE